MGGDTSWSGMSPQSHQQQQGMMGQGQGQGQLGTSGGKMGQLQGQMTMTGATTLPPAHDENASKKGIIDDSVLGALSPRSRAAAEEVIVTVDNARVGDRVRSFCPPHAGTWRRWCKWSPQAAAVKQAVRVPPQAVSGEDR